MIDSSCVAVAYNQSGAMDGNGNIDIIAEDYLCLNYADFENETIIGMYYFDNAQGYESVVVSRDKGEDCYQVRITFIDDWKEERRDTVKSCSKYKDMLRYIHNVLINEESYCNFYDAMKASPHNIH